MICESDYCCFVWMGLNDRDIEGRYVWDYLNVSVSIINWYFGDFSFDSDIFVSRCDCIDMFKIG